MAKFKFILRSQNPTETKLIIVGKPNHTNFFQPKKVLHEVYCIFKELR